MSTTHSADVRSATPPASTSYKTFQPEESIFHSRWIYGNSTSRAITYISNSDWYRDAYHPDGSVKSETSRIAYGAVLAAAGIAGAVCDLILNVLAFATLYFAGKKIYEYALDEGAFAPPSTPLPQTVSQQTLSTTSSQALPHTTVVRVAPTSPANSPIPSNPVIPPTLPQSRSMDRMMHAPREPYRPFIPTPMPDMQELFESQVLPGIRRGLRTLDDFDSTSLAHSIAERETARRNPDRVAPPLDPILPETEQPSWTSSVFSSVRDFVNGLSGAASSNPTPPAPPSELT